MIDISIVLKRGRDADAGMQPGRRWRYCPRCVVAEEIYDLGSSRLERTLGFSRELYTRFRVRGSSLARVLRRYLDLEVSQSYFIPKGAERW